MFGVAFSVRNVFWCCTCLTICPHDEVGWGRARYDRISTNSKLRWLLPSRYRVPPSSRRKAMLPPDSASKKCNTLYLAGQGVWKKDREFSCSLSFSVGANCVRPRAFTERPYEIDFAVGKTCFMESTPWCPFCLILIKRLVKRGKNDQKYTIYSPW